MSPTSPRVFVLAALLSSLPGLPGMAAPCAAQGLGVGGRLAMVKGDVDAETNAERFTGGQLRARMTPRAAIEVSLDVRTQSNEALTERVRDYPLQASLLLYPVRATFAPYVLGGLGWYSHRAEALADGRVVESETSRKFGYHAGFGAELALGRHAGVHADYRYTFLRFGSDEAEETTVAGATAQQGATSALSSLLPSYKGSMWTAGLTIYF